MKNVFSPSLNSEFPGGIENVLKKIIVDLLGLLIECLKKYEQMFITVTKSTPKVKKRKKAKWLSEEAFQVIEKEEMQKAREKGKDIPTVYIQMQSQEGLRKHHYEQS